MAITHFLFGMGCGIIILLLLPWKDRLLRTFDLFFTVACGFWAMLPDVTYIWNDYNSHRPWMNIFFLHIYLDQIDPTESIRFAVYAGIFFLTMLLIWNHKLKLVQTLR